MDSDVIGAKNKTEMLNMASDALGGFSFKLILFLYLIFIIVCSDVFIDKILSKFDSAVDMHVPTTYGTLIQGAILVVSYIFTDVLIKMEVL